MPYELTQEHESLCEQVYLEYDGVLDSLPRTVDDEAIRRWLGIVYSLFDLPLPTRVEIVDSPKAAFDLERSLTGNSKRKLDDCGIGDSGWVAFYDFFHRIGVLSVDEATEVLALREFQRSAWDTILLDDCAIVVRLPTQISRDEAGNLHSSTGPAIRWHDGCEDYAWAGVWVPQRVILSPRDYTREEFDAITSTEVRRALCEAAGWEWVAQILGGAVRDQWIDPVSGLTYELMGSETARWLKKLSPVLQDGTQPVYVEPVHENLRTAQAARKWQATSLSPEECEADPWLTYGIET